MKVIAPGSPVVGRLNDQSLSGMIRSVTIDDNNKANYRLALNARTIGFSGYYDLPANDVMATADSRFLEVTPL